MRASFIGFLAALCVSACAVSSDDIKPTKKGDVEYAFRSCQDLTAKHVAIESELAERTAANDSGQGEFGNVGKISELKGERDAIRASFVSKKCPHTLG